MSQLPMSANLKNNKGDQQSRNERHTFVLVHGGWCGGWIWRYVAPALREQGHVVTTPTLTDLGERRHLENRTATLSTHIEDVVAHIEMEGFQDVILVSQSYGGHGGHRHAGAHPRPYQIDDRNRFSSYLSHSRDAIDRIYDASHCY
jgi:pimeloyl-ACP methyl ester carboxylesterase